MEAKADEKTEEFVSDSSRFLGGSKEGDELLAEEGKRRAATVLSAAVIRWRLAPQYDETHAAAVASSERKLARGPNQPLETRARIRNRNAGRPQFLIRSVWSDGSEQTVWRFASDFDDLRSALHKAALSGRAPSTLVKTLAVFSPTAAFRSPHPDLLGIQAAHYDALLKALVSEAAVRDSDVFKCLLRQPLRPDWPGYTGPIDLDIHDLPHASSHTEWWYINTHLELDDGRKVSAFFAFFRTVKSTDELTGEKTFGHALNWALTDCGVPELEGSWASAGSGAPSAKYDPRHPSTSQEAALKAVNDEPGYYFESIVDKDAPSIILRLMERREIIKDPLLLRAYREVLGRGNVPLPDKLFPEEITYPTDKLDLDFKFARFTKLPDGRYHITGHTENGKVNIDLKMRPLKPAVRHGNNGVVVGHDGDDMFYYLIPRCDVEGTVKLADGKTRTVSKGQGWYDHEFGGAPRPGGESPQQYAWNWAAIQLSNGVDISVSQLLNPRAREGRTKLERLEGSIENLCIVVDPEGNRTQPTDLTFAGSEEWTSVRTFMQYPLKWNVRLPSAGVDLTLEAEVADQELLTIIAKPAFWEGRVRVSGTFKGEPVTGLGFVERNGFGSVAKLNDFFKKVGEEVRRRVIKVYPDEPGFEDGVKLIADDDTRRYMKGVDMKKIDQFLLRPVRHISDAGGKSWRSYGALACMDVVGGDSRKFVDWLAMPEFMHVGSLIVDDFQDKSEIRRGRRCSHLEFGDAVAINAGTAAYFQGQKMITLPYLTPQVLNRVYDLYFAALRGGHAGQALDLAGSDDVIEECIAERKACGDAADVRKRAAERLEEKVLAVHMLKTAVPAGALARMGSVVGGGTPEQVEAMGNYFEKVGVAFQIMDDVLNLRGLTTNEADKTSGQTLKTLGEDITAGKVTICVANAAARLGVDELDELWKMIKSRPEDRATIDKCIEIMESCGAIEACCEQARDMVEEAWLQLDLVIPDSFSKIMLRSFGWFVIERTR
jgi:geranylgeranyl pyrophosphate synthase/predicted secreted hydrolase